MEDRISAQKVEEVEESVKLMLTPVIQHTHGSITILLDRSLPREPLKPWDKLTE